MRKCAFLGFLFSLLVFAVFGQGSNEFEEMLMDSTLNPQKRVDILNTLSRDYSYINQSKALDFANEALKLSNEIEYLKGQAYSYRNLSGIYSYNDVFSLSFTYIQQALNIFTSTNDSIGIANCFITLGHTYRRLKDRENEVKYHKQAFEVFATHNDVERKGVSAHNLGESYLNIGEYDKCRELSYHAIGILDSLGNLPVLSSCYKVMGMLEYSLNRYDSAEIYFQKVLQISEKLGEGSQKNATIESMIHLSKISEINGNQNLKIKFLKNAAQFCKQNNISNYLQGIYTELINYYTQQNNLHEVNKYLNEFNSVIQETNNKQSIDRAELVQGVVKVHDLEFEKERLNQIAREQQKSITQRNLIITIALISLIVLTLMVFVIQSSNKNLAKALKTLKEQSIIISEQKKNLEELNATKDKFFSIVAHDFKSPLNSLKSFSSILSEHIDQFSKEDIAEMSKQLNDSIDNTIKMADNLLTWARIQMKDFRFSPTVFLFNDIISNLCDVYKDVAGKKDIGFVCNAPKGITIYGDKDQITLILRNLVNNAIKFSNRGGLVELNAVEVGDMVKISISDQGIGLNQEQIENLFNTSQKSSTKGTEGEEGTGLGLMLTHEFIKMNGGNIEVESETGKGTTFFVILKRLEST